MRITPELLRRYDQPGPRYTSYPTAVEWKPDITGEMTAAALGEASSRETDPLSLYVHLPYCASRCLYCGCNATVPASASDVTAYLDALVRELDDVAALLCPRRVLSQLHWGGGTPNYLTPEQAERLREAIAERFTFTPDAEIAIEINPSLATPEQLRLLRNLGFNRISLGVQDLAPEVQRAVARNQTWQQTRLVFETCRELGFQGINIDLIYGLPLQRAEAWQQTLDRVCELRPDRIAVYSFAWLPDRLPHQQALARFPMPEAEEKLALFAAARNRFITEGYRPIGMDHFALPEDELSRAMDTGRLNRNFMGYTVQTATEQVGIGASAISEFPALYAQNVKDPGTYIALAGKGLPPTASGVVLDADDRLRRRLIRDLMCRFRLRWSDLAAFHPSLANPVNAPEVFADAWPDLQAMERDGLVELQGDGLTVTPLGRVFVRVVCMAFDIRLRRSRNQAAFSRTV
ncbi:MAG TPA: oxygen-independent coproporphyrinogen III oxidase [Candidatus Hydrogenedentes bacterium]|nr:oxygen-independent coproporphyrinogen III oxidase [Candidatus Hydrogenedentota bacterium]